MVDASKVAKTTILQWLEDASANGYNRLVTSKFTMKIFWAIIIFFCYICMAIHLSFNFTQFFSYEAQTNMEFSTVKLVLPDITICRHGLQVTDWGTHERLTYGEFLYKSIYKKLNGIDKTKIFYYYLARPPFAKHENFSREHIGEYLLYCFYDGKECNFNNFTLYRDPYFTNCFIFTPHDRSIVSSGKVLTLALYVDDDLVQGHSGYVVSVSDRNTRPDILHNNYDISTGGITKLHIRQTQVELLKRPYAPCSNEMVEYLYTFRKPPFFRYRAKDCVNYQLQKHLLKNCNCISSLAGVTPDLANETFCHHELEKLNPEEKKYLTMLRQYGKNQSIIDNYPNKSAKESVDKMFKNIHDLFNCHKSEQRKFLENPPKCMENCKFNNLADWHTFESFSDDTIHQIAEYVLPENQELDVLQDKLIEADLFKYNLTKKMIEFGRSLSTKFTHEWNRNKTKIALKLNKKLAQDVGVYTNLAMLNVYIIKAPGDAIVESRDYELFSLLSDIGGNMGLWAGFSIISMFEFIELFFLLIGKFKKAHRNANQRDSSNTDNDYTAEDQMLEEKA